MDYREIYILDKVIFPQRTNPNEKGSPQRTSSSGTPPHLTRSSTRFPPRSLDDCHWTDFLPSLVLPSPHLSGNNRTSDPTGLGDLRGREHSYGRFHPSSSRSVYPQGHVLLLSSHWCWFFRQTVRNSREQTPWGRIYHSVISESPLKPFTYIYYLLTHWLTWRNSGFLDL